MPVRRRSTACAAPRRACPTTTSQSQAFDKAFKAAEPKDVERLTFDAQTFDTVMLCYLAAVAAGSTEGADIAAEIQAVSAPRG